MRTFLMICTLMTVSIAQQAQSSGPRGVPQGGSGNAEAGVEYNVELQKIVSAGFSFYTSPISGTGTMNWMVNAGVLLNETFYHGVEYFHDMRDWKRSEYEVVKAWGANYNFFWVNDFETGFFRINLGARVGYSRFEEESRENWNNFYAYQTTHQFGGPQVQSSLVFNRFSIGTGYCHLLGFRDDEKEKHFANSHYWNIAANISF